MNLTFIIFYYIFRFCTCQLIYKPVSVNKNNLMPHVLNGRPAKLGDAPYQVAFKERYSVENSEYITFCGGVLIAPNSILTAAHCFESNGVLDCIFDCNCGNDRTVHKKKLRNKFAVAGNLLNKALHPLKWQQVAKDLDKFNLAPELRNILMKYNSGQWRSLRRGIYPNKYKFPNSDIAVITTVTAFEYTDHVKPIPVASMHTDYTMNCLVSGYGKPNRNTYGTQSRLLLAELEIIPTAYCSRMHKRNMYHFICTSTKISDAEKGDSGGPLICQGTGDPNDNGTGVLVGIVSGHLIGVGSFFTRISSYNSFITKYNTTGTANSIFNEYAVKLYAVFIIYVAFCLF